VSTKSLVRATNIIGASVVNPANERLGGIKEFVIDPGTGRVAYAVIAFGGFLGLGEKLFAIPFDSLAYDIAGNGYVLDVSVESLESAPGFHRDYWPAVSGERVGNDDFRFFGRAPYWE
jgi:sporulation protein YlmC with PRC-barrel domain